MKFYVLLYLWICMLHSSEGRFYPAITMIYYPGIDLFAFVDLRTIQSSSSLPDYALIILLCPYIDDYKVLVLSTNTNQIFSKGDPIYDTKTCKLEYKPEYSDKNNAVGYYINVADEILNAYNLPSLNRMIQNNEPYAFYKIMDIEIESIWKRTAQTTHTLVSYKQSFGTGAPCEEYSNGISGLDKSDTGSYYSVDLQNKKWNRYAVPQGEYLVPHRLVPTGDFVDDGSRRATCFDWNTIPIWSSISSGSIDVIEDYIRYMADMVDINTLTVTTIVHDILTLPKRSDRNDVRQIYLGSNQTIPVPRIFMKILHYQLPIPNQYDRIDRKAGNFFHFYVAIVVHNQLETPLKDKLCEKDVCSIGVITKNRKNKQMFYCCDVSTLQIKGIETLPQQPYGLLNLTHIPTLLNDRSEIVKSVYIPPIN